MLIKITCTIIHTFDAYTMKHVCVLRGMDPTLSSAAVTAAAEADHQLSTVCFKLRGQPRAIRTFLAYKFFFSVLF